jgi:hypothetical protein
MGGVLSTYGEMRNTKFWLEILKGRDYSEDIVLDGNHTVM